MINRCLLMLTLSVSLSGCIVQSTQMKTFLDIISRSSADLLESGWQLRYSNYVSTVYAVSIEGGILFSNQEGDEIIFDGWTVRKIKGLGDHRVHISINDAGETRFFARNKRTFLRHTCNPWERRQRGEMILYSQQCTEKKRYQNRISVDLDGNIFSIRQIIDEKYFALTLTKLK